MILFNRYEYNPQTDLIGKGGFARVYKALDKKLNRKVALKIYKPSELSGKYSPIAEIQRVIELDHPNITRYIDIEEIEREDSFGEKEKIQVCVMELLEGGNLSQYYRSHQDLLLFKKLLIDVLNGLSYLHRNGITHRDIKPSNILIKTTLDGPIAKITDFGISKKSDSDNNNTASALIVSIPYMAPEQLNAQKYGINGKAAQNIDFWSLGVAVFEVITGEVLFRNALDDSSERVMSNILSSKSPKKLNVLPEPYKSFVSQCIVKDAKLRVSKAEELATILSTPTEVTTPDPRSVIVTEKIRESVIPAQEADNELDQTQVLAEPRLTTIEPELQLKAREIDAADETTVLTSISKEITKLVNDASPAKDETVVMDASTIATITQETNGVIAHDETQVVNSNTLLKNIDENETQVVPVINEDDTKLIAPRRIEEVLGGILAGKNSAPVTLFNRYEYRPHFDMIGKGGFSRVYKAFDNRLGRWVALKIYKTSEYSDRYSPIAEIKRVVNLDHPNICRYLDIEELEKINPFGETEKIQVCVMELLDGGNIGDYYKTNNSTDVLKTLVQDVLNGISYLHKKGIIHRDIKPANILIKENVEGPVAKITDFGISKGSDSANTNSSSALIVSIPFMAPEQFNPKKYGINETISANLDLWSLGVTLYEVITGKVLFKNSEHDTSEQIMANIMAPEVPDKISELPEPFRRIVACCLVKDARKRAQKAEELMRLLNSFEKVREEQWKEASVTSTSNNNDHPKNTAISNGKAKADVTDNKEPLIEEGTNITSAKKSKFVIEDENEEIKEVQKWRLKADYKKPVIVVGIVIILLTIFLLVRAALSKSPGTTSDKSFNTGAFNIDSLFGITVPPHADTIKSATVSDLDSVAFDGDRELAEVISPAENSEDDLANEQIPVRRRNSARDNQGSRNAGKSAVERFTIQVRTDSKCVVQFASNGADTINAGKSIKYYPAGPGSFEIVVTNIDGTLRTKEVVILTESDRGQVEIIKIH
jgi:serine/threonine protein kinase